MKKNFSTLIIFFVKPSILVSQEIFVQWGLIKVFALILLQTVFSAAHADSFSWFGGNGNWEDKTNWAPEGIPGSEDAVFISSGKCETSGAVVKKLFIDEAALIISGDLTVTEILTMTGQTSVIGGRGNLNIDSVMNWGGGDLRGPGQIQVTGDDELFISGEDPKNLYRTINNHGLIRWQDHDFAFGTLYGDGLINNYGSFEIESDGVLKNGAVPLLTINNYGTIRKQTNMASATIQPMVNNYSEIVVSRGTLALNGGGFNTGTYNITNANDTLRFTNGIISMNGNEITGNGVVHIDLGVNGRFSIDSIPSSMAFGTTLFFDKGVINGTSDIFDIQGDVIWAGGSFRALDTIMLHPTSHVTILGDGQKTWSTFMINKGVIDWKDGDVTYSTLYAPPDLGLLNENVVNLEAVGIFANGTSGNGFINNVGLIRQRNISGLAKIRSKFNNYGQIEIQSGTLELYGGGTLTNYISIDSLASLNLRQNIFFTNDAFITGKGTFNVELNSTSSLNIDSLGTTVDTTTNLILTSGLIAGKGQLHVYGNFTWEKGELRGTDTVFLHQTSKTWLSSDGEKKYRTRTVNNGELSWEGGLVRFQNNNGQPYFRNNGSFEVKTGEIFGEGTLGNGLFHNYGKVNKSTTEDNSVFKCYVINSNEIKVSKGQISLLGGSDFTSSTLNLEKNSILRFQTKDHILNNTIISGAGIALLYSTGTWDDILVQGSGVVVDTATIMDIQGYYTDISGDGPIHLRGRMNWGDGIIRTSDTLHIYENALLNIHSNPDKDLRTDIINYGQIDWIGGNVKTANSPVLKNYGLFNLMSDGVFGQGGSGEIINFKKSKKIFTSASSVFTSFKNMGLLEIEMGRLSFHKNLVNDSTGTIAGIDTLDISAIGMENLGLIAPGLSAGKLRVLGDLPFAPSSKLHIEIGGYEAGVDHDVLDIEGEAILAGNMMIELTGGFEPEKGATFKIMTYESFTGTYDHIEVPTGYRAHVDYDSTFLTLIFDEKMVENLWVINDTLYIMEDEIDTLNVLRNDINKDKLTMQLIAVGAQGTIYGDSSIIYTPTANFFGIDSLDYRVEAGDGKLYTAKVYVFIEPVNDSPDIVTLIEPANGDSIDIMTEKIEFSWTSSTDVDNDPLTYTLQLWNNQLYSVVTDLHSTSHIIEEENVFQPGTTYYWNVAVSDGQVTLYSDTATFVTKPVEVLALNDDLLKSIELNGNFPNPFHQNTTISFNLLGDSHVIVDIYSMEGSKIQSMDHGFMSSGQHQIKINANGLSEGILMYNVIANNKIGNTVTTGKMIHLK